MKKLSGSEKFIEKLHEFKIGHLVTCNGTHDMSSRPMSIAEIKEESAEIVFLTGYDSLKTHDIQSQPKVLISFQKGEDNFLSVRGEATVSQNKELINKYWKPIYKVWFPEGKEDADICIVTVTPKFAEYWDNEGINKVKYLYGAIKGLLMETAPVVDSELHGTINL